ncbi:hypothetical protein MVEN_01712300 [Mycena venus]|uniref:Uncharacterized protein n=1 Tax=Mycena venus TaxID=2733690 RepID=A0A8H7CQ69_9AGAR|nr:hypothetical protein MVEN_01712300 [Mycena venus]
MNSVCKICRQKHFEEYAADSSAESESDTDSTDGLPQLGSASGNLDAVDVGMGLSDPEITQNEDPEQEWSDEDIHFTVDPPRLASGNSDTNPRATPEDSTRKRRRPTVEEVEDEDERWVQPFPPERGAGEILRDGNIPRRCKTQFQKLREKQAEKGHAPWEPFESEDEWELAHWLMTSGLSGKKTDTYLKLKKVREGINPSFHNNRAFLKYIDALPEGPQWTCYPFELVGDELLLPVGSTLVPIIIASDKTQLTRFSGNQQAWPVYLTIGNIDKATRRRPSSHATVLLGYIPVAKLEIFSKKRSGVNHQLFHDCMRTMLQSLKVAERDGVTMDCADGFVRKMYLILAAYIADYPEQCLCRGNTTHAPWRCPTEILQTLADQSNGEYPTEFVDLNLRAINPFWADLPHCDIFRSMTPDLLHELHNGVFGYHLVKWSTEAMNGGQAEVDLRFCTMSPHPSLRHFKKGISLTTQWTGTERKNMEKVFLGVLANATAPRVQLAVRGILDFIHYAHFETHCDDSLLELDGAWSAFHNNKDIYVELEIRKHFNISKLHKLKHYVDSIRSRGTADGTLAGFRFKPHRVQ